MRERTTAYLAVSLLNKLGRPEAPTGVTYRVDCMTTGESVRAFTPVATPAAEFEIVLTADDNAMRSPANESEDRRVTVVAIYASTDDRLTAEFDYKVSRVRFLN